MRIEVLFPECANLFGELGDIEYLAQLFPEAEIYKTRITDPLRFVAEDMDLVFMAPMSEKTQEMAIARMRPHVDSIRCAVESGMHFLCIGNSMELFGEWIENEDGSKVEGLGIFPLTAKRQMTHRLNSLFLGEVNDIEIVGSKAQFTQQYLPKDFPAFCEVKLGIGLHEGADREGIHYKNFIGTTVLGPFMIMNPAYVKLWARELVGEPVVLPFEDLSMEAYARRCAELHHPKAEL